MPKPKLTARQKLACAKPPQVKRLDKAFADMPEGCRMLIASPAVIAGYIQKLPAGQFTSLKKMRADLAEDYQADHTCPVTTGIFLRIAAEAAWEDHLAGLPIEAITPFWRVIEPEAPLAAKLACGVDFIAQRRAAESQTRKPSK